jgi:aryl-alcohol dehydrogenase
MKSTTLNAARKATMQITAAVLRERAHPFEFAELQLDEPRTDEVLVLMVAAGICHADLSNRVH